MSMNPTLPQTLQPETLQPQTLEKFIPGFSPPLENGDPKEPPKNMEPEKWLVILALCVLQLVLLFQLESQNDALRAENGQLKTSLAAERTLNREKVEKLEKEIDFQQDLQERLRKELSVLETNRSNINTTANENKAALRRIRDADSLYRAVARHYQP